MIPKYTGTLRRLPDGTYGGELRDNWGWRLDLTARVVDGPEGRHFVIEADPNREVPQALRIPGLDDQVQG